MLLLLGVDVASLLGCCCCFDGWLVLVQRLAWCIMVNDENDEDAKEMDERRVDDSWMSRWAKG